MGLSFSLFIPPHKEFKKLIERVSDNWWKHHTKNYSHNLNTENMFDIQMVELCLKFKWFGIQMVQTSLPGIQISRQFTLMTYFYWLKFLKSVHKKCEKAYFNQQAKCEAPIRWPKYTTSGIGVFGFGSPLYLNVSFFPILLTWSENFAKNAFFLTKVQSAFNFVVSLC